MKMGAVEIVLFTLMFLVLILDIFLLKEIWKIFRNKIEEEITLEQEYKNRK